MTPREKAILESGNEDLKDLALAESADLSSLSHRERVAVLRAMLKKHEPAQCWFPRPRAFLAFQERLYATLPSKMDCNALWIAAYAIKDVDRASYYWDMHVSEFERWMAFHETKRLVAAAEAPLMPSRSDPEIEIYLYKRTAHCKCCADIAVSQVPAERLAPIWAIVKKDHYLDDEDRLEARQATW